MSQVRTRFAPSPTGFLHIGGVRTALFNWLYARRHGGRFILRIDDTDQERNVMEALQPILDGFRWLGIEWDEGPGADGDYGPYYQSERSGLYADAVEKLLASGHAYRDYATAEELQTEREAAQAEKRRFIYSRKFMADTDEKRRAFEAEGRPGVVRLKMPREGACRFTDSIRGEMELEWAREQDHVVQRADGSCLYNLATVVDDHAMAISHVIRAEEHLSNTPRQLFIYEALGWEAPQFAHLPFVAEPGSKNKLSKRKLDKYMKQPDFAKLNDHGRKIAEAIGIEIKPESFNPVVVDFYEQVGFLPDAVVNYLLLLGWALDDKTEWFTREAMIEHFSLERVNKAAASFDPQKLMAFQEHYMVELPVEQRVAKVMPFLEQAGLADKAPAAGVAAIVEAAGDRIKVGGDILDFVDFFTDDDALPYDEKAFEKRLRKPEDAAELLKGFREVLAGVEPFETDAIEGALKGFVEERGIKIGQIVHAVRVAATGKAVGFGLFEALWILGRERCLKRFDRALAQL
ncbi:glutamyl-tRNA synthetase [Acidobacteria bacterium Mor1]|nr:glutamyl-tRNA synthetase [Acidobacteria bacterium Mor1]